MDPNLKMILELKKIAKTWEQKYNDSQIRNMELEKTVDFYKF